MKVCDVLLPDLTPDSDRETDSPAGLTDLVEADRLVLDLTALVEAGLVAVQEPVFGPARYGVVGAG